MSKATRFSTRLLKEAQPSLNKVGIIYENQQGIELAQWLSKESNRRALDNKRILYVVRANIDNSLILPPGFLTEGKLLSTKGEGQKKKSPFL